MIINLATGLPFKQPRKRHTYTCKWNNGPNVSCTATTDHNARKQFDKLGQQLGASGPRTITCEGRTL